MHDFGQIFVGQTLSGILGEHGKKNAHVKTVWIFKVKMIFFQNRLSFVMFQIKLKKKKTLNIS